MALRQPVKLSLQQETVSAGQAIAASGFISAAVAGNQPITEFAFYDAGQAGGHFTLNGVAQPDGQWIYVTPAQLGTLGYSAGSAAGSESIYVAAWNGHWTTGSTLATTTAATPVVPSLVAADQTLNEGQTIAASSLIASTSDPNNKAITQYSLTDSGTDGHLYYNGTALVANQAYTFSAAQLANVSFVSGSAVGTDSVSIKVSDGGAFSSAATAHISVLGLPTVIAANQTVTEGQSISAALLIASTQDPNNKAITQYSLTDSGSDGHLVYNGTALAANQAYTFTAAQLANVSFVAGSAVGTDSISIKVSDGGAFSSASTANISVQAPLSPVAKLQDAGIAADVSHLMSNGSLSYGSMVTVLEDAASSAMTATKFTTLQTLASLLNATNGITASSYVQQMADDVIDGNAANAYWNGGANTATALGNLSASSTQTQFNELIGKWFLGSDLPSLAGTGVNATYQASTLPLFGSSGVPSNADVNQGYVGDCYLMSALGETALRDPSAITSMITSNGNGTDAVRFYVNGVADYVTVNTSLPIMSGMQWANQSKLEFANGPVNWVALIEKAYVQLDEQLYPSSAGSAYENISGGSASTLTEITNQSVKTFGLTPTTSATSLASTLSTLIAGWKAGDLMMLSTPYATSGNLIGDHMFQITGIDATTGVISILNPWNAAVGSSSSLQMAFTETIQQLAADSVAVYDSPLAGASSAAHATVAVGHADYLLH